MKIIDAHLHLSNRSWFDQSAAAVGEHNSMEAVQQMLAQNNIVMAVAMGAGGENGPPDHGPFLADLDGMDIPAGRCPANIASCAGLSPVGMQPQDIPAVVERFARCLQSPRVVGLKLYPGYHPLYVSDSVFHPFYDLAAQLDVPVVIHTGDTANRRALLKYAHPLTVDEVAVAFPHTRFVMAHCGNPWIIDAVEVARKNPNVSIDLSAFAEGRFTVGGFLENYGGFVQHIQTWLACLGDYSKLLYGSDWPLVRMQDYIALISHIIPPKHHEAVFYHNALSVFTKLDKLL